MRRRGAILTIAASKNSISEGVMLLAVYSLGLGIPFLLTSLAINQFFSATKRIRKYYHAIEVTSGAGIALQAKCHRELADALDEVERLLAFLLADDVAEDPAEKANVGD